MSFLLSSWEKVKWILLWSFAIRNFRYFTKIMSYITAEFIKKTEKLSYLCTHKDVQRNC